MTSISFGPLVPLDGGDGEAVTAWRDRIATLGRSRATIWLADESFSVDLPDVPVSGARWSADGARVQAGTGAIDVGRRTWTTTEAVAGLAQLGAPGAGHIAVRSTSWSSDGRFVAVLLDWAGPPAGNGEQTPRVVVVALSSTAAPVEIPVDAASGVRIVGEVVIVAAPTVSIWSFDARHVADLPARPGAPLVMSGGDPDQLLLVDQDWSVRIVDVASWSVVARWSGPFLDAVPAPDGSALFAIGFDGVIHAARTNGGNVEELGTVETGIGAGRLAVTEDSRLVIVGAGPVAVHTMTVDRAGPS